MRSLSLRRLPLLLLPALATGCMSHSHMVGLGPTGTGQQTARQFYLFFGLVQLNEVDAQRMAPNLSSYTISTSYTFVDLLFAPLLLPLTGTSRTVVVRT